MEVIKKLARMRAVSAEFKKEGRTIGFVPTMGALHEGHLSLVRRCCERADVTVVSIFVNPAQFAEGEDLSKYPRDLLRDTDLLSKEKVEVVFTPSEEEMYPKGFKTFVDMKGMTETLEGEKRPEHFRGVCTVVSKLFNIVRPDVAVFGWKDAQQAAVVERMTKDLNLGAEILRAPIVREPDGLAMSSRNGYLGEEDRRAASIVYKALCAGRELFQEGEAQTAEIRRKVQEVLESEERVRDVDYVAAVDPHSLREVRKIKEDPVLLATAVRIGDTRLLDNVVLERDKDG